MNFSILPSFTNPSTTVWAQCDEDRCHKCCWWRWFLCRLKHLLSRQFTNNAGRAVHTWSIQPWRPLCCGSASSLTIDTVNEAVV